MVRNVTDPQASHHASRIPLADHLSGNEILRRYRSATRAVERTHWHIIYLKSQGRIVAEIADITGYSAPWIRRLIHRYNETGPGAFIAAHPRGTSARVKALERDYARKSEELELARQVQQLMLTSPVPRHPDLDIAVFMETATELGGDYYDFHLGADGALTVAVGDATGHGARAGMMVTATKTLFKAMGHEQDLLALVRQLTHILKSLNLRGLYMHLTICRYYESKLQLVVAGMPPILVYRAASRHVQNLVLRGMPLGSFPDFPYRRRTIDFEPGDAALLMSDGFEELRSPEGKMMEAERVCALFKESADRSAEDTIAHLRAAGTKWAGNRPLNDDVTLVVLKRT